MRNCLSHRVLSSLALLVTTIFISAHPAFGDESPHADDFTITNYHANFTICKDASVTVEEVIDFHVTGPTETINRDIAIQRACGNGEPGGVYVIIDSLQIDGKVTAKLKDYRLGGAWRVEIPVVQGERHCRLKYTLYNSICFLPTLVEFNWDLVGTSWQGQIEHAEVRINFEPGIPLDGLEFDCHTGSPGYKTGDCFAEQIGEQVVVFATRGLRKFEGLKISMNWQPGVLVSPSKWQQFVWEYDLRANWLWAIPIFTLLIMTACGLWAWKRLQLTGPTNSLQAIEPIDGDELSIPDIGMLYWERDSEYGMTALMLDLAGRGHLEFREILDPRVRDYQIALRSGQRDITSELEWAVIELSQHTQDGSIPTMSALGKRLLDEKAKLRRNVEKGLVKRGYLLMPPSIFRKLIILAAAASILVTILLGLYETRLRPALTVAIAVLAAMPIGALAYIDMLKTARGVQAYRAIERYRDFLIDGTTSKSAAEIPTHDFEQRLPYALILDAYPEWTSKFRNQPIAKPEWLAPAPREKMPEMNLVMLQNVVHSIHLQLTPSEKIHTDVFADFGLESDDAKDLDPGASFHRLQGKHGINWKGQHRG